MTISRLKLKKESSISSKAALNKERPKKKP
jgi:hypothetical protein